MVVVKGSGDNQVLYFNRGDDVLLDFTLKNSDGTTYTMAAQDYLSFTIREFPSPEDAEVLASVSVYSNSIRIRHDITDAIEPGEYSADCELHKYDPNGTYDPDDPDKNYIITTIWPSLNANYIKHGSIRNYRNCIVDPEVHCNKHND